MPRELPGVQAILSYMPRVLSLFLVLLLLVRGLVGDAMAVGVAAPFALAGATSVHAPAPGHGCPDAQPVPATEGHCGAQGDHGAQGTGHCVACGICHSAFSVPRGVPGSQSPRGSAPRPEGSARFASAEPAPAFKPPIS